MSVVEKVGAGKGRVEVRSDGSEAVLSELSYSYPLKLLSPRLSLPSVSVVYVLTYGGGLVAGDSVDLKASVKDGMSLVLLTQVGLRNRARAGLANTRGATSIRARRRCSRPA